MIGFVLGTGCCGSSLVHEMLARHSDVGFISNIDDLSGPFNTKGSLNRAIYSRVPQSWTGKGRLRFAPSEGYRILAAQVSPLIAFPGGGLGEVDISPRLVAAFGEFFHQRWEKQGSPHFLHKFTGASRVRLIATAFPEARFVHVVRDGRAVANSFLKQPWWLAPTGQAAVWRDALNEEDRSALRAHDGSALLLAGLAWRQMIEDHEQDQTLAEETSWLQVRYEDILDKPHQALQQVCEHLGMRPSAEFEQIVTSYHLEASRADGFRRELDERQLSLLDQYLAPTLRRLGYV